MRGAAEFVKEKFKFPIVVAEVGVEKGINAAEMVQKMNIERLYAIDHYLPFTDYLGGFCPPNIQDEVYDIMFKNLSHHWDKIVLVTRTSVNASKLFSDEFFDFIYIDGNHNYDSVRQDIDVWFPKVKKGGLLGGHDYDIRNIERQDVTEAVKDFAKENSLEVMIFPGGQPQFSDWGIIR